MSHRTPLRIFLLALGAMALGLVGAVLLGRGSADAAVAGTPPAGLEIGVNGGSVTVGPVTAVLPAPLPVAGPIQVAVPLPPVVVPIVDGLPVVGEIAQTPIRVGLPTVGLPDVALPGPVTLPAPVPVATANTPVAPVAVPLAVPVDAGPVARSVAKLGTAGSTFVATTASMLATTTGTPSLPSSPLPWTLAFGGLAAAFVTAGADGPGGKRFNDGPFVGVVPPARGAWAQLLTVIGSARPEPSRPGFALLLARPG